MAGAHLGQRMMFIENTLDQYLNFAAAFLYSEETRLEHTRIVQYQQIVFTYQGGQLGKHGVFSRLPAYAQQATGTTPLGRVLRDQVLGKFEVKFVGEHQKKFAAIRTLRLRAGSAIAQWANRPI